MLANLVFIFKIILKLNNFKFSYGLRVDVPVWDKGTVNNDFNTRTIPF
jgi:hypothetical protein